MKTLDGESKKLSDYKGNRIILNMWATWCPPCRAEMPDMQRFYDKYTDENVVILGINLTSSEKNQENITGFIDEFGISFPILLDEKNSVADRFQAVSIPTSYMIDSRGVIQHKNRGTYEHGDDGGACTGYAIRGGKYMNTKGKSILIVEDDCKIRQLVKLYLEKEGYEVFEAGDGEEALASFNTFDPCFVILDLMLPKMSGENVCQILRADLKAEVPLDHAERKSR